MAGSVDYLKVGDVVRPGHRGEASDVDRTMKIYRDLEWEVAAWVERLGEQRGDGGGWDWIS